MTILRRLSSISLPLRTLTTNSAGRLDKSKHFDIVIVGGGMVGFALAALTGASNILKSKRVLLLETAAPDSSFHFDRSKYQTRTVALNLASQRMLEDLNAWDWIASKRAQPVRTMKVWEQNSDSFLAFERDILAYIVENKLVVESLKKVAMEKNPLLTVLHNTHVTQIHLPSTEDRNRLVAIETESSIGDGAAESPMRVETNLLVGADGIKSKVRESAGLSGVSWDHGQSAVVAALCMGEDHEEFTAWQRFTPTGPIAMLPMSSNCSNLIWSTTNAEADRLLSLSDEAFVRELNEALICPSPPAPLPIDLLAKLGQTATKSLDYVLGYDDSSIHAVAPFPPHIDGLKPNTTRSRYPLGFQHANAYHCPRVAIVGDAAHRILPLAGQGVNLGFGDIMSLVKQLEEAVSHGADLGSSAYLKQYTSDRQRTVVPVAATMEAMNLLYSTDAMAAKLLSIPGYTGATKESTVLQLTAQILAALRTIGVRSVQSSGLMKKFLIEAAITGQIGLPTSTL